MDEQTQKTELDNQALGSILQNPATENDTPANGNNNVAAPPPAINPTLEETENASTDNSQNIPTPVDNNGIYPEPDSNSTMGFVAQRDQVKPEIQFDDSDFSSDKKKKILKVLLYVGIFLSLAANGALTYFTLDKIKIIKNQETTIANKTEENKTREAAVQKLKDELAAATAAPVAVETPAAATPTPTTSTKKSTSSKSSSQPVASSQEEVIAPPPAPSD
jgi:hypothetical protein